MEMIYRYETYEGSIDAVLDFIGWLRDVKEVELAHANGATVNDIGIETLVMEFHGIDRAQLDKERRVLIAANKAVAG